MVPNHLSIVDKVQTEFDQVVNQRVYDLVSTTEVSASCLCVPYTQPTDVKYQCCIQHEQQGAGNDLWMPSSHRSSQEHHITYMLIE